MTTTDETTTDEDWAAEVDEQERQISGEVSYSRCGENFITLYSLKHVRMISHVRFGVLCL